MRLLAVLIAALATAAAAPAAVTISASPVSATAAAVTLNGDDQVATFTVTFAISGVTKALGYNATAWAPAPVSALGSLGALRITAAPALTCTQGGCTTGTNSVTYPLTLGTSAPTATKIFNAAANSANKNQQAVVTFAVPVAASTFPGTYTTTLTVNVADGP